ncbi:MAG: hypothetical protein WCA21_17000 [Terracidiphilus sp.]
MNRSFHELFSRSILISVAITAIVLGAFNSARARAKDSPDSRLDGDWVNIDPNTRGIVEVIIAGKEIHPYGACHPTACNWGVIKAKSFAESVNSSEISKLVAKKFNSFSNVELTISRETDGRLRVEAFTHFTDRSGRPDYSTVNYFQHRVSPIAP